MAEDRRKRRRDEDATGDQATEKRHRDDTKPGQSDRERDKERARDRVTRERSDRGRDRGREGDRDAEHDSRRSEKKRSRADAEGGDGASRRSKHSRSGRRDEDR